MKPVSVQRVSVNILLIFILKKVFDRNASFYTIHVQKDIVTCTCMVANVAVLEVVFLFLGITTFIYYYSSTYYIQSN